MNQALMEKCVEHAQGLVDMLKSEWGMSDAISDSSELAYERAWKNYSRGKSQSESDGITFRLDKKNKNTRTVYSAAIRRNVLIKLLRIDQMKTEVERSALLAEIRFDLKQVEDMTARYKSSEVSRTASISSWKAKILALEKIRPNWRDELQAGMRKSKYAKCIAVQRATGCRTEELVSGVRVVRIDDRTYELSLKTAKQRVANTGNRMRVIHSTDRNLEQCIGVVRILADCTDREGRSKEEYGLARALEVEKAKRNYRMTMANASERLFGLPITPKAFRCSMASDLRSSGANTAEVAEFLGHGSTACANAYSRGLNVRGKARAQPAILKTARVKVEPKPLSKSLSTNKVKYADFAP